MKEHIYNLTGYRWSSEIFAAVGDLGNVLNGHRNFHIANNSVNQIQKGDEIVYRYYTRQFPDIDDELLMIESRYVVEYVMSSKHLEAGYVILGLKLLGHHKI